MRLLIVNADDFGLNAAATDGIIDSHVAGSVTSTTLMVNAPDAERAATLAQQHPGLGVGLHFNLTWGRPLSPPDTVPALLASDGTFLSRSALARRLMTRRVPLVQVACELQAQAERIAALGVSATHVDSHQHVHGFGVVFDAVARHCQQAGLPMRVPWVASVEEGGLSRRLRRSVLSWMLSRATKRWSGRVSWNDALGSVFDLGMQQGPVDDAQYRAILAAARGDAFELMVHPVTSADAMAGFTSIGEVGEAEWHYLRTGRLPEVAEAMGFRLGTYRDLHG